MSFVTLEEVRALIDTDLEDEPLQAVIDGEEAWLARRVGPLGDERTERFIWSPGSGYAILRLRRSTTAEDLEVEDGGSILDADTYELRRNGFRVAPIAHSWAFPVEVTYTPNDAAVAKRGVLNLIRLALKVAGTDGSSIGIQQETIGSYSYTLGSGPASEQTVRSVAVADLLEPREPSSARVLSSVRTDIRERYIAPYPTL